MSILNGALSAEVRANLNRIIRQIAEIQNPSNTEVSSHVGPIDLQMSIYSVIEVSTFSFEEAWGKTILYDSSKNITFQKAPLGFNCELINVSKGTIKLYTDELLFVDLSPNDAASIKTPTAGQLLLKVTENELR